MLLNLIVSIAFYTITFLHHVSLVQSSNWSAIFISYTPITKTPLSSHMALVEPLTIHRNRRDTRHKSVCKPPFRLVDLSPTYIVCWTDPQHSPRQMLFQLKAKTVQWQTYKGTHISKSRCLGVTISHFSKPYAGKK